MWMSLLKNKWFWLGLIILIILVGIAWHFYNKGKQKTTIAKLPTGDNSTASDAELVKLAGDAHDDMDGWFKNIFSHNQQTWVDILALSDVDFVKLYNIFNTKYQKESGQTFIQWIDNEFSFHNPGWAAEQTALLGRANKLNLK